MQVSRLGALLSTSIILLFLGLTHIVHVRSQKLNSLRIPLSALPMAFGDWKGREADPLSASSHDILKLDQYLRRYYENSKGEGVFVYVGYWEKQSGEHQAAKHSPLMCLPANGWKISNPEARSVPVGGSEGQKARQLVGLIKEQSLLFYYWFFSGEETYVDETEALFRIAKEAIIHGRSDGGIVELSTLITRGGSQEDALAASETTLKDFVKSFAPELNKLVRDEPAS